ncbi:UNVERIFIED_CONTAM: hypothetical protein Sangu_2835000 [Sesamum angustifolium]|uniref:Uncharacterized protein n=1 Tax=Sesamum angustifolium TaxID=2727405 RepID=A0AAW2IR55_9LAMI
MTASGAVRGRRRSRGTPEIREQQRTTCTLVSSLRVPRRAAAVDVSSWRSEEAHHTIAGPSQPSSSIAPTSSPPQPKSDNLHDQVQMIERYIKSCDPDWPDRIVPQPPANPPHPTATTNMLTQMSMI